MLLNINMQIKIPLEPTIIILAWAYLSMTYELILAKETKYTHTHNKKRKETKHSYSRRD